jgi:ATP-binding cassette subfamily B protein
MQRLAVARALLAERPVLILDEATSALDAETERKLLENLKALQDVTIIAVTHRPAAMEVADRVINLERLSSLESSSS